MNTIASDPVFPKHNFPKTRHKLWDLERKLEEVMTRKDNFKKYSESLVANIQNKEDQQISNVALQHSYKEKHEESLQLHFEVKQLLANVNQLHNEKKTGMSMVADHNVILENMMSQLFALEHKTEVYTHAIHTKNNVILRMNKNIEILDRYELNQKEKIKNLKEINKNLVKNIRGYYLLGYSLVRIMDFTVKMKDWLLLGCANSVRTCESFIANQIAKRASK